MQQGSPAPNHLPIPAAVIHERRRTPRLEVLGVLHGQLVPLRIAITVREISFAGFSIETVFPLPVDAMHDFRFTLRNGTTVTVRGKVVHCREEQRASGSIYVAGLLFADSLPTRRRKAQALVTEVESAPAQ